MARSLNRFELIVRAAASGSNAAPSMGFTLEEAAEELELHPFDKRNIHPGLPKKVRKFFDNGLYSEATFEAYKYLDKLVQKLSGISRKSGEKLMMEAFNETAPQITLTPLVSQSEIDEQRGFKFLFSGAIVAIRNPRGHEVDLEDDVDTCLDHLAFASLLIRRLEQIPITEISPTAT